MEKILITLVIPYYYQKQLKPSNIGSKDRFLSIAESLNKKKKKLQYLSVRI